MKTMTTLFFSCIFMLSVSINAYALTLSEAKAKGLVGEQTNGYLAAVTNTPAAKLIVEKVNIKRREKYQELAAKNNLTLDVVAKLAGKKAIEKTKSGNYIKSLDGKWIKKP
ncbi:YdbL family protein [Flocculibacter collagenilyticus]|uniref:YdbL family protein n=1 Tax=Flocculibacter collagenilyticus TaxID=2744479 RepID=UPI0018F77860|nr:YdbL family protein [Flocculibacter collagenilyticus]